ncbi:MAG: hypothetical protein ACYC26_10095 [Phycisphaerales bacterium]
MAGPVRAGEGWRLGDGSRVGGAGGEAMNLPAIFYGCAAVTCPPYRILCDMLERGRFVRFTPCVPDLLPDGGCVRVHDAVACDLHAAGLADGWSLASGYLDGVLDAAGKWGRFTAPHVWMEYAGGFVVDLSGFGHAMPGCPDAYHFWTAEHFDNLRPGVVRRLSVARLVELWESHKAEELTPALRWMTPAQWNKQNRRYRATVRQQHV